MKIIILHRPDTVLGGDMIALRRYAGELTALGVDVELRPATQLNDLCRADFVHLWAACSPDWGLPAAREAKRQGARLIVTPFWWSRAERLAFYQHKGDVAPGYTEAVGETLRLADVLFTVTMSEVVECWKLAPRTAVHVVPMGFDEPPVMAQPTEDYVLCIGRIEPHKNQFMLAAACHHLGLRLILLGEERNGYAAAIREHYPQTEFVTDANDATKWDLLSHARVHALPSFFENPGLVHGEAALLGIPAVMGSHGCEPEFFGQGGIYCNPTNLDDIAQAIIAAWNRPRQRWAVLPTWKQAAGSAMLWMEYMRVKTERAVETPWVLERVNGARDVLDIGSAGAKYLPALAYLSGHLTAVDTRPFTAPDGVEAHVLDARNLPEEWSNRFDLVTCVSVLDHVGLDAYGNVADETALTAVCDAMIRVLKPGGRLLVTVPVGKPQLTTHPGGGQRVFGAQELPMQISNKKLKLNSESFWNRYNDEYLPCSGEDVETADYDTWRADAVGCYEFVKRVN